ncbi:MAG: hypothetical protein ABI336_08800 [Humibacillus sp.]
MSDPTPLQDLIADDRLLDRLGARLDAGNDPLALMLAAVATKADRPLPVPPRRRRVRGRRLVSALALLTVGVSGAGVAAAVTLPVYGPGAAEHARVQRAMDDRAADSRPSALLSRLGIPADADLGAERDLVLVRLSDGQIVLVPTGSAAALNAAAAAVADGVDVSDAALNVGAGVPDDARGADGLVLAGAEVGLTGTPGPGRSGLAADTPSGGVRHSGGTSGRGAPSSDGHGVSAGSGPKRAASHQTPQSAGAVAGSDDGSAPADTGSGSGSGKRTAAQGTDGKPRGGTSTPPEVVSPDATEPAALTTPAAVTTPPATTGRRARPTSTPTRGNPTATGQGRTGTKATGKPTANASTPTPTTTQAGAPSSAAPSASFASTSSTVASGEGSTAPATHPATPATTQAAPEAALTATPAAPSSPTPHTPAPDQSPQP